MEIGVWGDSITYGEGDSEALGWVGRLRKSFLKDHDICVYNFGVCGNTTDDLLKRFSTEASSIMPDIVVLAIGINDSKYTKGEIESTVPLEKFKQNMRELIVQAKNYTNKIYIMGATKVDDAFARSSGTRFINETIRTYNDELKGICQEAGTIYISVFDVLNTNTDLGDGLHPNAQGYEKLFRIVKECIKV